MTKDGETNILDKIGESDPVGSLLSRVAAPRESIHAPPVFLTTRGN